MNKRTVSAPTILGVLLALGACGGSSGGSGGAAGPPAPPPPAPPPSSGPEVVMVSLGDDVRNVLVQPNTITRSSLTFDMPAGMLSQPITTYQDFSINLEDTMASVQITSIPVADNAEINRFDPYRLLQRLARVDFLGSFLGVQTALAATPATVTVYLSYPGDPDACVNGSALGSYNFDGEIDAQPTSDTAVATTDGMDPRVHIATTGSFELCFEISPVAIPMDAYVTVSEVALEAETCELPPLPDGNIVGDWSGTYSCTNVGLPSESDLPITLTISENTDGSFTYVDDSGTQYDGHFCGSEFRFSGGVPGDYTEGGKITISNEGRLTKVSTWNSDPPGFGWGNCFDDLTKN